MSRILVLLSLPLWFVACARMTIDPVVMSPSIPVAVPEKGKSDGPSGS